ncbi:MAG: hypothetical protein FJZ87_08735 [Chloroflexi bacterium]|nr:hypothetical protein [Chloroflexota bacterium]
MHLLGESIICRDGVFCCGSLVVICITPAAPGGVVSAKIKTPQMPFIPTSQRHVLLAAKGIQGWTVDRRLPSIDHIPLLLVHDPSPLINPRRNKIHGKKTIKNKIQGATG